ncbi:MAG: DNA polymerase I [Bacteroidetes bacterium GWF2_42_66]|nr:MAG: DNA polymerase I [Bacteroidetes bacterium GWE2_42_39]OFY46519.1 MAG: DNA polymerase I [Bacteroidetes bacterium GWF2_42_66]HBL75631.1 DNA polymerase I [Prolixibacteraceae bacterium]HCU62658.1 DNA polymerase I [Prolixibacteraceae bacterium]
MSENKKRLFLLDAYALIYRSYFAFIKNPRFNSKGLNTSAMFGFVNTLDQLLKNEKPSHIAVVFDLNVPTFRHEMFDAYKANREEMPEDLRKAIPYIRQIIEAYNIPILEKAGFEADDVIGTLAKMAETKGYETFMVTPDKDYAQLVSENIFMYKPARGGNEIEIWGVDQVKENFMVERPEQVIDVLGLMGDTSDNIPGCPGIGPKTAMKLISDFGSIDNLYKNIDQLKGKQKENLEIYEKQVRMSQVLAKIILDVPVSFDETALEMSEPDSQKLKKVFTELEFRTFMERIPATVSQPEKQAAPAFEQGTLFGASLEPLVVEEKNLDTIEKIPHDYYLIETPEQRASLRAELSVQDEFCFDTETTGLDTRTAELVCLSFSFRNHEAYCVPVPKEREKALAVVKEFELIFGDERIVKIGQNLKYDISVLMNYNIEVKGPLYDTMIAHYLIQPELRHNLDYLCEQYLGYEKVTTESLIGKKGIAQINMRQVPVEKLRDYACEDADLTLQLKRAIDPQLDQFGVRKLFNEVEMPLVYVLADMEMAGVRINPDELNRYAEILRHQIIDIEREIIEMAGEEFNISSPKQLGVILFEKLKIDSNAKKTKTKQYSTSEDILEKLADRHPIVGKILDYRGLKKLLSTYVEALPLLINPRTGKVHTSYNQAIAATGRLSSTDPNLQNIPIRDANGREIRKAFIPSDENHLFLSADYSQIELRIMAALSKDEQMLEAFRNGDDIHAITASKIYKIPVSEVSSDMRRKAKTANFGIIYGISAFGLSQRLNIPRTEAKELIDGYFENFSSVKQYMDESILKAREAGFVQTIMGRKRYLSDINSANAVVRGVAERNAINAPIQGSAADIIKLAMVNIWRELKRQKLQSKMVMQVHDELNFDVVRNEIDRMKEIVRKGMENAVDIGLPLTVEMNTGANWLEAH